MPGYIKQLQALSPEHLAEAIGRKITDSYQVIMESDEVASTIAMTNATGFKCDKYEIHDIEMLKDKCNVEFSWEACGEHDLNKAFSGDSVSGTALAQIDDDGRISYRDVEAAGIS